MILAINFYETKYINNEYSVIDEEMNLYLFESISPKPSQNSLFDMRNAFMRAKIQFLRYIYEYLNGVPRLSIKTQNDYIQTLSSIFMWAKKKKFIDENPFDEVEMPAQDIRAKQGDKYLSFSITQLQAIFNTPVYRGCMNNRLGRMTPGKKIYRDAYFWVPLISLYSGARLNEICQLSLDDVRIKEGINIIHISNVEGKKVKTFAGHRDLPIHPVLLKLGFLGYVEQQRKDKNNKSKRLFPELKLNSRNEYPPQTLQGLAPCDFALSLVVLIQFLVQRFAHLQVGL